jgi:HAD superfamily hydrolase (TIGR01509 family)
MIKNIVFDMGGVLINLNKKSCIAAFNKIGFTDIDQYIGKYIQNGLFLSYEKGEIDTTIFLEKIQEHIGKQVAFNEITDAWCAMLLDIPAYKLNLLRTLRKKYRTFMLSNTNAIHFERITQDYFEKDGFNLQHYFENCYLSYQMKCVKPTDAIYIAMLHDAQILASETLFIDDSAENIESAKKLGFHTYLAQEQEDFSHLFVSL